jgi:hypothetical protein
VRVLLTEGSGLTSRQVAGRLAALGHEVGVLSSDPFGLTRFTRATRRWHRVPPYGADPLRWFEVALDVYRANRYEVLLPTQEQVAVLAACSEQLRRAGVVTAVPPFAALAAVQDKVSAFATLSRLGVPQPAGTVMASTDVLSTWDQFPAYLKTPIGTAASGVRRVTGRAALVDAASEPAYATALAGTGLLVQAEAFGPLAMVQAVFARGELVAIHTNWRVHEGARGGASHKCSVDPPGASHAVERLGHGLGWHGALSADVVVGPDGAMVIDVNPRLVEPGNALASGVDLVDALLDVAIDGTTPRRPPGASEVSTHQLLLAVLGAAQHGGTRRAVARELLAAARRDGPYGDSVEELTPLRHDVRSALPVLAASIATLVSPRSWAWFASGRVDGYALTPDGWAQIQRAARLNG